MIYTYLKFILFFGVLFMALMPGLQLNIGQQLKLTPQLQQSIKILQYSALEIQQTISTTLESNFMLEVAEEEELENTESIEELSDIEATPPSAEDEVDLEKTETIADKLEMDYEWEEVYSDFTETKSNNSSDEYSLPETYTAAEISLKDKLYWQSDIYQWQDNQELIASYIIDSTSDEGYLKIGLEEVLKEINNSIKTKISLQDVQEVLEVVQNFEPSGVAARNLAECLCLQLKLLTQNPFVVTSKQIIENDFELLVGRDYKRIKKIYLLDEDELEKIIQIIQSLNPRPGRIFSADQVNIVIPDLKLSRAKKGFLLELNQKAFPRLTINSMYIDMVSELDSKDETKKIKEQLVEAKGLIKSIQSRGETLLRVGKFIIEKQADFFEEGDQAMKPMVLGDVAENLGLHESTISRATSQKYMQTPRGTFELKYFFSTALSQYGSSEQSAISIKYHIKKLITDEDASKPLSDNKLMGLLEEQDISVARRTIAKYREAMHIASSSNRKK